MTQHVEESEQDLLSSFAALLDGDAKKGGAKAGVGGLLGGGVVTVMRLLAKGGMPWDKILTTIPLIIELRQAGKSWAEVIAEVMKLWLSGGVPVPPPAPAPA